MNRKKIKDSIALIGALSVITISTVNYIGHNPLITGIVGISLLLLIITLYIISRDKKGENA